MFSIVVMSSTPWEITEEHQKEFTRKVDGVKCPMHFGLVTPLPDAPKAGRAPKGSLPPRPKNIREVFHRQKHAPKLEKVEASHIDRPYIFYFDVLAEKSDIIEGQTSAFVAQSLDMLFRSKILHDHNVTKLRIWSDGYCG